MLKFLTICVILLLSSCAGYRFQEKSNPFAQYGVKSISVPMFYNHSLYPNISAPMTKEVYHMLSGFSGLRLYSGRENADAVLIGIITSPEKTRDAREARNFRSAKNASGSTIGERRDDFYIPATTDLRASLRIILIKSPSAKEIELLKSSMGKFAVGSKIIVNESIGLSGSFTREIFGSEAVDVTDTQNRSAVKNTITDMSERAAQTFKDMILYAF